MWTDSRDWKGVDPAHAWRKHFVGGTDDNVLLGGVLLHQRRQGGGFVN